MFMYLRYFYISTATNIPGFGQASVSVSRWAAVGENLKIKALRLRRVKLNYDRVVISLSTELDLRTTC